MLAYVPASAIDAVWPEVEPWLLAVEKRSRGRESAADLRGHLAAGALQLWLWQDDGIKALAVAEIMELPGTRLCRVRIATGRDRRAWLGPGLAAIEAWAAENGCSAVEPICRRGWEPELKALGYRTHHIEMSKELRP